MAPNISNNASFAKNSSGNLAIQGNNIYNPVICSSNNELMKMLSNAKQYEAIQAIVKDFLSAAATAHPLQPHFTAKYSSELERLISAPETEEALKKYPKTVKGTYRIDYNQFPYMDRSETPWAYAYRTQTKVELETTSYKEYLGDQEDPFPVTTYSAGMITIIEPPPFPDAVEASISSGESSIPISFRRKPCMEYGQVVFGIESLCGNGINIDLVVYLC